MVRPWWTPSTALRLNGLNAASTLEEMTGLLQRMAVLQAVPGRSAESDDPDEPEIERLAQAMPADETQLLYSLCLHGRGELGLAPDEYAALTMVLLRLLAFKPASAQAATAEKKTLKSEPEAQSVASALAKPSPVLRPQLPAQPPAAVVPVVAPAPDPAPVVRAKPDAIGQPVRAAAPAPAAPANEPPPWDDVIDDPDGSPSPPAWDDAGETQTALRKPSTDGPRQVHALPVRDAGHSERLEQRHGVPQGTPSDEIAASPEGAFWLETVQALVQAEAVTALVRELALQSQLVARDAGRWVLRVERESLTQGGSRDRLRAALQAHGHDVELALEVGPVKDSPARRLALAAERRQREAEQLILDDPFVQSMMRDFGGKIVPGTLKATAPQGR